jgi:uncharacterized protein YecE (DUF72 family)
MNHNLAKRQSYGLNHTPGAEATSSVGHIRLHGRNYKTWFAGNAQSHERYDYLYKIEELEPWLDRVKAVARRRKSLT